MQVRIIQINEEGDVNFLKFLEVKLGDTRRGTPSIYDEVFCGEAPCMDELSLYEAFTPGKNPLFRGDKLVPTGCGSDGKWLILPGLLRHDEGGF